MTTSHVPNKEAHSYYHCCPIEAWVIILLYILAIILTKHGKMCKRTKRINLKMKIDCAHHGCANIESLLLL